MHKEAEMKKVKSEKKRAVSAPRGESSPCCECDFGFAMRRMREGRFVRRASWENGVYCFIASPGLFLSGLGRRRTAKSDARAKLTVDAFVGICKPDGYAEPYTPTHDDMLALDWTCA